MHPGEALLLEHVEVGGHIAAFGHVHRGHHQHGTVGGEGPEPFHHVLHGVALHLLAADGGEGASHPGEEQLQVVVDLGAGAHGAPRVAGHHLLLDGDGRADAQDAVHIGLLQPSHELPGVAGEALDVAALPLRVEGVEGQAALAAAAEAGHHHELSPWDVDIDVLQVVHPGALDADQAAVAHAGRSLGGAGGVRGVHTVRQRRREVRHRLARPWPPALSLELFPGNFMPGTTSASKATLTTQGTSIPRTRGPRPPIKTHRIA